jgi:hypothetical protein
MIEVHVENGAPDHDTLSIDVACNGEPYNITVSRDEHGEVHMCVTDIYTKEEAWYTLGRPGVRRS